MPPRLFYPIISELDELISVLDAPASLSQWSALAASSAASPRIALRKASEKVAHESVKAALVLCSTTVDAAAVLSVMPRLLAAASSLVSAMQLVSSSPGAAAAKREARDAVATVIKALRRMFEPLALGGGAGAGGTVVMELPSTDKVRAACSRAAAALPPACGRVQAACDTVAALPPDELQAVRRALLSAGKLLKASLTEISDSHGLRDDANYSPLTYDLSEGGIPRAALAGATSLLNEQWSTPPLAAAADAVDHDTTTSENDDDDRFDDATDGPRLPADAAAAFVRVGVAALQAFFAAVKAAQPIADRLGARLVQAQASARLRLLSESAPAGLGAAAAEEATASVADSLHAALSGVKDAAIDLAAAVDDDSFDFSAHARGELRAAIRASSESMAALTSALQAAEADAAADAASSDDALPAVRAHLDRANSALALLALLT